MQRRKFLFSGLAAAAATTIGNVPAYAQGSPPKVANGIVGGKGITINYYSPSMRGRKIYGELVPYGQVWCPGANWATHITSLDAGLEIGTMKLGWGSYSIWVLPNEQEWQAIINSDAKAFHLDHEPEKDLGRIKMNLKTLEQPVESLTFEIRSDGGNKGTVALLWEKTEASFPFAVVVP
jgi:Protein of unknown function (DUF2911)